MAVKTFGLSKDLSFFVDGKIVNLKAGIIKADTKDLIAALEQSKFAAEAKAKAKE
tara:strand:- start:22 stop:186 length:165 start_codon:yes stop_codon:yes gene_type:complete